MKLSEFFNIVGEKSNPTFCYSESVNFKIDCVPCDNLTCPLKILLNTLEK